MAGQIINAVKIRRGWLIMTLLCVGLSVALLPSCYIYIGGRVSWRARKAGREEKGEVEVGRERTEERER